MGAAAPGHLGSAECSRRTLTPAAVANNAVHNLILLTACWLTLAASDVLGQADERPVARVFGEEIRCSELRAREARACAVALLRRVQVQVIREYVEHNALNATPVELERLAEYNRAFERHDRTQRGRKLVELETRLVNDSLTADERRRLENFRDTLTRLAAYEADVDAGIEEREPIDTEVFRGWVESAKVNALLYSQYGGIVGLMAHGPYAHGALTRPIAEHIECGSVEILDARVATFFQAALRAPPRMVHPQGEPDFTPFWERPIAPSYIAN